MNVIVVGAPIRIVREISESGRKFVHENERHSIFFACEGAPDSQVLPRSAWAQFRCRQVQEHANKSEGASVWMSAHQPAEESMDIAHSGKFPPL
jgi:hypothetical protein